MLKLSDRYFKIIKINMFKDIVEKVDTYINNGEFQHVNKNCNKLLNIIKQTGGAIGKEKNGEEIFEETMVEYFSIIRKNKLYI